MESDYAWSVEVKRAMQRHQSGESTVVPIIVSPVHWQTSIFGRFQVLPHDGRPVTSFLDRNDAWASITSSLDRLVEELASGGKIKNDPVSGGLFVWVPPGSFTMGIGSKDTSLLGSLFKTVIMGDVSAGSDEPAHKVSITKGFWIGKYPVTQAQWQSVMRTNPSSHIGADRPVDSVSWLDCKHFTDHLNRLSSEFIFRLPTEAEWEYAARAGTTDPFYGGQASEVAWFQANSDGVTHPVGQKLANPWGLHDVLGNVWEWCSDWMDLGIPGGYYSISPERDPQGPNSGLMKVLRGGAAYSSFASLRVSMRSYHVPNLTTPFYGFRCLMRPRQ